MTTAIQRGISGVLVGIALGALATALLVWCWIGPRRKQVRGKRT